MLTVYASMPPLRPVRKAPAAHPEPWTPSGLPPPPDRLAAALGSEAVLVSWSGGTRAKLEPSGCVPGMAGGLVRRGALLTRSPAARSLHLECGGWSAGAADYQLVKLQAYLEALAAAGIAAVGLGQAEAALGGSVLGPLVSAGPPVVCCNVVGFLPSVAVERSGQQFVITSVVAAGVAGATDPVQAVARLATPEGSTLIIMADLDPAGLASLAAGVPSSAVVIARTDESGATQPAGPCRILPSSGSGAVQYWWALGADAYATEAIADIVPDHPAIRSRIAAANRLLGTLDFAMDAPTAPPPGTAFVGDAACRSCHAQEFAVHAASRHALPKARFSGTPTANDPECLTCHTTGLGAIGGFSRRGQSEHGLNRIGCESCHGPGAAHVSARIAGDAVHAKLPRITLAQCSTCHDAERNRQFDVHAAWNAIAHGPNR
ncbi:hypothetical protein LBMAG53_28860 [Planctomycetota bacterium]|nr:hypothetical protein LBMAG53_28860 [Planctomycetota bacterium]